MVVVVVVASLAVAVAVAGIAFAVDVAATATLAVVAKHSVKQDANCTRLNSLGLLLLEIWAPS